MRLIGTLDNREEAERFCRFLLKERIQCFCEVKGAASVWVEDEDQADIAFNYFEKFKQNPEDAFFYVENAPSVESLHKPLSKESKWKIHPSFKTPKLVVTYSFILICALLFFWNTAEQLYISRSKGAVALQVGLTPLQENLMYDFPKTFQMVQEVLKKEELKQYKTFDDLPASKKRLFVQAESEPYWKGLYFIMLEGYQKGTPLFEKISQGQFWRLFTPVLLHGSLLHILFNMLWLWLLSKQIEPRIGSFRLVMMVLIIGIISNTAQYFMSGPAFLGFSGVICGMGGFIYVRQKIAPWEGYPLNRSTLLFLAVFVLGMFALQLIAFILQFFNLISFPLQIANTAHIVGGLSGMALAKVPYFFRRK